MTNQLTTKPKRDQKGRIRPALSTAIQLIVTEGLTISDAAQRVGMARESLSRALIKPHVRALREAVKRAWLSSETDKAWLTVAALASGANSEDVKLKAAKVILEAAGELGGPSADAISGARSLVNIVIQHPVREGDVATNSHGVIELIRTPGRSSDQYELIDATGQGQRP
jgi:hypothetical protein